MGEKTSIFYKALGFILKQLCKIGVHTKSGVNAHGEMFCWSCYHLLYGTKSITFAKWRKNPYEKENR